MSFLPVATQGVHDVVENKRSLLPAGLCTLGPSFSWDKAETNQRFLQSALAGFAFANLGLCISGMGLKPWKEAGLSRLR